MGSEVVEFADDLITPQEAKLHRHLVDLIGKSWGSAADGWDRDEALPEEVVDWCVQQGLIGATVPREFGGGGWSALELGLLYEAMGRVSASLASLVNVHAMVAQTLARWGSDEQRQRYLPDFASGRRLAAVSMTERNAGSDLSCLETTLDEHGDQYVLSGAKLYTTFGQRANTFLVLARNGSRTVFCLVDRHTPGLEVVPTPNLLGLRAARLAEVHMHGCAVDRTDLVGRSALAQSLLMAYALQGGRHAVAWMAAGMLSAALSLCAATVLSRTAFGRRVADHGQIQSIVTAMGVDLAAARGLCVSAARALDTGSPTAIGKVLMAKYFCTRALEQHAAQTVQAMGALGCLEDNGAARLYRDAKVLNIIEGTPQLLERLLAPQIARDATEVTAP